jgi:hypothetical protein
MNLIIKQRPIILTIRQLSIIEGCTERNAKAIKRKILNELKASGKKLITDGYITDVDFSHFRGVPPESIYISLRFEKRAFIQLKDIMRLFGVQRRQASYIKKSIACELLKKDKQKISVLELACYLGAHYGAIYALMDVTIRRGRGIKNVSKLGLEDYSCISRYVGFEKRKYSTISEFPEFWQRYKSKFEFDPMYCWEYLIDN